MSLRKDFKSLSASQKNRRLRKRCKLYNVQNENIEDKPCTSKSSETNQIRSHCGYNLCSNVLNNNANVMESSSESDSDNSEVSCNYDITETSSTIINQQKTIKFKEQLIQWICE